MRLFAQSFLIVTALGGLLWIVGPAAPQADDHPLLQLLALVPDDISAVGVSYADYRAMEVMRSIDTPDAEDFENRSNLAAYWIASADGLAAGMTLDNFEQYVTSMTEAAGFSFFDIDRSLVFGGFDSQAIIVQGSFDGDKVTAALKNEDYVLSEINGVKALCSKESCEAGSDSFAFEVNLANPFGGEFGRQQAVILNNDLIFSARNYGVVEHVTQLINGNEQSLEVNPDYRAIAEAVLSHDDNLIQIQFYRPDEVATADLRLEYRNRPQDAHDYVERLGVLPAYSLAALADSWDGENQITTIALVVEDEETAALALGVLITRFEEMRSSRRLSLIELLNRLNTMTDANLQAGQTERYTAQDGTVVLALRLETSVPANRRRDFLSTETIFDIFELSRLEGRSTNDLSGALLPSSLLFKVLHEELDRGSPLLTINFVVPE